MKKKIIGTILTLLCTSVVAFSGWQVYKIMSEYQSGEKVYLELEEYVSPQTEEKNTDHQTESSESENKTILPVVEFEKLKSINNDFVAWIYCEGTAINYPVVHYKDNTYYLKHMFDGSYNSAGCIFLDCRNSSDFTDENNIIYGHHMKNNSMFSSITKYKQQAYYDEHPELLLMTPEQNFKIELFSGYVANVEDEAWQLIFDSEEDRAVWIERTIEKSTFNSPVIPAATDKIITLSTCSYEFDNARYVLTGVLTPIE